MRIHSKVIVLISLSAFLFACKKKEDDAPSVELTAVTISASAATLGTGAAYSSGAIHLSATGSNQSYTACANAGSIASNNLQTLGSGSNDMFIFYYTPAASHILGGVTLRLAKTGTVSGDMYLSVYQPGSSYSIASTTKATSSLTGSYTDHTFTFSTPPSLTAGTAYSIRLYGAAGCLGSCTNYSASGASNGVSIALLTSGNCNNSTFGDFFDGTSTGLKGDAHILAPSYYATSTATFIGDAGLSVLWSPADFTPNENPSGETGTYTYDVGVGETSTPTYAQTGLTKAQVQALSQVTGRYVFIKATLTGDGFSPAGLGDLVISYVTTTTP